MRLLAAITLDVTGEGVATASRLMLRAMRDEWGSDARAISLDRQPRALFVAKVIAAEARSQWVLYGHLGVARVHRLVPSPVRRPYAVFLHGIEVWKELSGDRRQALEKASVLLANSAFTARRVREFNPWIGPIHVTSLALPDDVATPPRIEHAGGQRDASRTVLIVGRMSASERYKGHDELLEAWPRVLLSVPDAKLVMAGGGDDRARLEAKARAIGIGASVEFVGFVSNDRLADLYRSAAVFAMPSRNEGFGLVYLEAMRNGLPCIASTVDAGAEVVSDEDTGCLVDPADTFQLSAAIVRLLTNADLRRAMGDRAMRRVEQTFSYEQFRRALVSGLSSLETPRS